MRKTTLRRLEALEKEHRSREQKELSSLQDARMEIWTIVLAYYLGDLKPDETDTSEAYARALNFPSYDDYGEVLFDDYDELLVREIDAYRRLFAKVGLAFEGTPLRVLFDAFVTMVNQLPEQRLSWLRSKLREKYPEIDAGSNIPRRLSSDNFISHPFVIRGS